ncbi:pentapeptide repeat-containing protein [Nocardiopsis sp. NPDC049922]|uniref:pentapeptide repeat-containing protein n=1 Tax=Nocardiopsis sp. NPDC049922 TaxID=3155157 RepID=UPI00340EE85A
MATPDRPNRTTLRAHLSKLKREHPHRLAISVLIFIMGGILLIGGGYPLAGTAWSWLWLRNQAGDVVVASLGVILIVLAVARVSSSTWVERAKLGPLIFAAWATVIALVVTLVAGVWWAMDTPAWMRPPRMTTRMLLDVVTARVFAIVAGLGGAALLVIAYRRQKSTEEREEREATKLFTERFTTAVRQLGEEHAAVRLGGVHALARLADDAPDDRDDLVQMVIDVLCAYLRIPYAAAPGPRSEDTNDEQAAEHHRRDLEFSSFREVRHTVIHIIGNHLRDGTKWCRMKYDFTRVVFDGGDLNGAKFFGSKVDFTNARFTSSPVSFRNAWFSGDLVDFTNTDFSASAADFTGARFLHTTADFTGANFSETTADFTETNFLYTTTDFTGANFSETTADFTGARFTGGTVKFQNIGLFSTTAKFRKARFTGATADFRGAEFFGGTVDFRNTNFTQAIAKFMAAKCFSGTLDFREARFTDSMADFFLVEYIGGMIDFSSTNFTRTTALFTGDNFIGGTVDFTNARFASGTVDFTNARFTSGTVDFTDAVFEPPPTGLQEAIDKGEHGAVIRPEQQQGTNNQNGESEDPRPPD